MGVPADGGGPGPDASSWRPFAQADALLAEAARIQVIRHIGAEGLNRRPPAGACRLFLGPGFRLAARWNRLVETVKTRKNGKKRGKSGRDTV